VETLLKMHLLIRLLFVHKALAGFISKGCYSATPSIQLPQAVTLDSLTPETCSNKCLELPTQYSLINPVSCICTNTTTGIEVRNEAECTNKCVDSSPCGALERFSLYELQKQAEPQLSVARPSPTSTAASGVTLGDGDALNQQRVALYASLGAAAVIIVVVAVVLVKRRNKVKNTPTLPRLVGKPGGSFLIPGLLPETTNLVYSCCTEFEPTRGDEIKLSENDIVCVNRYEDGWAFGANLSTNEKGYFPLMVLVEKNLMKGDFKVPPRMGTISV